MIMYKKLNGLSLQFGERFSSNREYMPIKPTTLRFRNIFSFSYISWLLIGFDVMSIKMKLSINFWTHPIRYNCASIGYFRIFLNWWQLGWWHGTLRKMRNLPRGQHITLERTRYKCHQQIDGEHKANKSRIRNIVKKWGSKYPSTSTSPTFILRAGRGPLPLNPLNLWISNYWSP